MNCPYCNRVINAFTGLQEAQKFAKHLNRCPKRPKAITVETDGSTTTLTHHPFGLMDALDLRAKSGQ